MPCGRRVPFLLRAVFDSCVQLYSLLLPSKELLLTLPLLLITYKSMQPLGWGSACSDLTRGLALRLLLQQQLC